MMAPMDNARAYREHIAELTRRHEAAALRGQVDTIVLGAGLMEYRFLDDQAHRFVASPHFLHWVPLEQHPGSAVIFNPGEKPVLVVCRPDDFWHQPPALPPAQIAAAFDLRVIREPAELGAQLPGGRRTALLGPPTQFDGLLPEAERNPAAVVNHLHYQRARKTAWEIDCVRRAAVIAAPGHRAAAAAFAAGASEYHILAAFLGASRVTEDELPYGAIVGLNEHGATLHYQLRERSPPAGGNRSLLIDAGCAADGYACDITRTYAARGHDDFAALIAGMDRLQASLCDAVRPGVAFPELHRQTHRGVGALLRDAGLVDMDPADQVSSGVTAAFLPHGLGHLLGILVHDVGGHMADDTGKPLDPPADFPKIRFLRTLEPGVVVTIEPGIYFIPSLLDRLKSSPAGCHVNWPQVDALRPYGGIRIEDDVVVTATGHENLTRPLLP
ncbi:MAG: Xaa-Pro dipeptidase [Gammaproteobacteria bacterium]|nr:Xaa-Pro dipeptidase [Gammaproteobacteria bacterium]